MSTFTPHILPPSLPPSLPPGNPPTLHGPVCVVHLCTIQPPEGGLPAEPTVNTRIHWHSQVKVNLIF